MEWKHLDDPQYWRERADEARYIAERVNDPQSTETMFEIAAAYERLVKRAEERRTDPLLL